MCGVSAILKFTEKYSGENYIQNMSGKLSHRGPDNSGYYCDNDVSLAHERLAIIDLSQSANQPMTSSTGRYVISWNGECYNYIELRNILIKQGVHFRTNSDTEVVLQGIEKHGISFIKRVNGMFAFALWDKRHKCLYLCRDRIGIKPLYYYKNQDGFFASSEIKPLLSFIDSKSHNPDALYWHLKLRYTPTEETLFKNIYRVPQAHILKVSTDSNVEFINYWDINTFHTPDYPKDSDHYFYELLLDSVKLRYRSNETVGAFLSSGIDSSSLVALSKDLNFNPNTFTLSIPGKLNETSQANDFSESLKLKNFKILIESSDFQHMPNIIKSLEEPIADSITLPTYLLMKNASEHHKVMISGEGADEVLAGYVHHFALAKLNAIQENLPKHLTQKFSKLIKLIPINLIDKLHPYPTQFGNAAIKRLSDLLNEPLRFKQNLTLMSVFNDDEIYEMTSLKQPICNEFQSHWENNDYDFLQALMSQDLKYWCPNYTLTRVDKLSMAHGLEVRVPFLDHRIVEYVLSLRAELLMSANKQKTLLREAMKYSKHMNKKIISRKKSPFIYPINEIFPEGIPEQITDTLNSTEFKNNNLIDAKPFSKLANKKHLTSLEAKQIFSIYCLELWRKEFLL